MTLVIDTGRQPSELMTESKHNESPTIVSDREYSSETSSNSNTTQEGSGGYGSWGWFDDIHGSERENTKLNVDMRAESKKNEDGQREVKKAKGGSLLFSQVKGFDIVKPTQEETISMAVTAPTYVLEESRSNQKLWKETAGNRPPQPVEERAFFEKAWAQNFSRSQAKYHMPADVLTASSPISLSPFADGTFDDVDGSGADCTNYNLAVPFTANVGTLKNDSKQICDAAWVKAAEADAAEATLIHGILRSAGANGKQANYHNLRNVGPHNHFHTLVNQKVKGDSAGDLTILVRGDNVFGTTVSKSFFRTVEVGSRIDTVSISIASYRVVESKKQGKYAQFLVIFCEGSFRDTIGVWKRYSDFQELSREVVEGNHRCSSFHPKVVCPKEKDVEYLPNAITSWRLLKKRQRWFRCLDAGYLSLKVFLLERFLHDILFESSSPQILRNFVGTDTVIQ